MVVGIFAGWLLDSGHLQLILIAGTALEVLGMFMTSLCSKYWQVLLAQGICVGLGSGLLGLTSVAVIPLYFSSKRMIATGIAATGSSLGRHSAQQIVDPLLNSCSWNTVSNHDAKTLCPGWLSVGCEGSCLSYARLSHAQLCRHASPPPSAYNGSISSLVSFSGSTLFHIRGWSVTSTATPLTFFKILLTEVLFD